MRNGKHQRNARESLLTATLDIRFPADAQNETRGGNTGRPGDKRLLGKHIRSFHHPVESVPKDLMNAEPHPSLPPRGITPAMGSQTLGPSWGETGTFVETSCQDDCAPGLECLNLDRHDLQECPLLTGQKKLCMLYLRHNLISCITHLDHLQCLVFLDISNNRVTDMSGLGGLTRLRVLILGNNRIQGISHLDGLTQLDVLDLHGNEIAQIDNVSHLAELHVLNLAENRISWIGNTQGLGSLKELNLQHNNISTVTDVDQLPCLQRLFLSCNSIARFEDLACLACCPALSELTLDGNLVAQEPLYRQTVLRCTLQLRQLDMKRVTNEERRRASILARRDEQRRRESQKQAVHKEKRQQAIRNAAQHWADVKAPTDHMDNGVTEEPFPDDLRLVQAGGTGVQSLCLSDTHLAELDGDTLRLFGAGALEALSGSWSSQTAMAVNVITFRYIHFDAIAPVLRRIQGMFSNLAHLVFLETNIARLGQLCALAEVKQLEQLTIDPQGNPVAHLALWRPFLIYRLCTLNLQKINSLQVMEEEAIAAERLFGTLGHVAATEAPPYCRLLQEKSRKQQQPEPDTHTTQNTEDLQESWAEEDGRSLLLYHPCDSTAEAQEEGDMELSVSLRQLVHSVSEVSVKAEALQKLWPSVFAEMVKDCVLAVAACPAARWAGVVSISHTEDQSDSVF